MSSTLHLTSFHLASNFVFPGHICEWAKAESTLDSQTIIFLTKLSRAWQTKVGQTNKLIEGIRPLGSLKVVGQTNGGEWKRWKMGWVGKTTKFLSKSLQLLHVLFYVFYVFSDFFFGFACLFFNERLTP